MPNYTYRKSDGSHITLFMSIKQMCRKERKDGTIMYGGETLVRDYTAGQVGMASGCSGWPMESDSAGVHPDQVPEAMEHDRKLGVLCNYSNDGNPIFTSKGQKDRFLKAHGLHDRN